MSEVCPCCNDNECFSWIEYRRRPEEHLKRNTPRIPKYKIGDKVWVSVSHNQGNLGPGWEDPIAKTELPTCAEIDLWLDCVQISCVSFDEELQTNLYDFCHDMVICTREEYLFLTKNEAIEAMREALLKMKE